MTTVFQGGLLLGLTLAFGLSSYEASAQSMGSGPIQTLPWATAKSRPKPTKDGQREADVDTQLTQPTQAAPIAGARPVDAKAKN